MWVAALSFLLLDALIDVEAEFRISGAGPRDGTLVKEGEETSLSCSTSSPWFQCQWLSPSGEKSCKIRGSANDICKGIPNTEIGGNATSCSLMVNKVAASQQKPWTCVLQDSKDLTTDRRSITLRVGRKAKVEVTVDEMEKEEKEALGPLGWSTGWAIKKEGNRLLLQEGQQVDLHCQARGANPAPKIEWMGPEAAARALPRNGNPGEALGQAQGLLGSPPYDGQENQQGWPQDVSLGPGSGGPMDHNKAEQTFSTSSTLKYRALPWHNNRSLTCKVTQSEGPELIYSTSYTLFLMVEPLPVVPEALGTGAEWIGMIVGITVGILLIIALIAILAVCLCRRRRRNKGSEVGEITARNGSALREQEQPAGTKAAGPGVWLRLTNSLRPSQKAPKGSKAPPNPGKPQGPRPSQARMVRTLSPIPGSVQSNSRPSSRTSQNLQGSRNSLASGSRHGSRTSVNTQVSSVNMAPGQGVSMGQNMGEEARMSSGDHLEGDGRRSPSYSVDETEML